MHSHLESSSYSHFVSTLGDIESEAWDQVCRTDSPSLSRNGHAARVSSSHPLTLEGDDALVLESGGKASSTSSASNRDEEDMETHREMLVHELQPSDSLPKLALQYGIPIADIRQANKLWSSDSVHLRKTLYIPLPDSSKLADESISASLKHATIRRVHVRDLSFFPPGKPLLTGQSRSSTTPSPIPDSPGHLPSQSRALMHIFNSLPRTEALLSRLSFDARESEQSDDHELQELHSNQTSRCSMESEPSNEESRTPMAYRSTHTFPPDDSLSHSPKTQYNPMEVSYHQESATIQTQPRPAPVMTAFPLPKKG